MKFANKRETPYTTLLIKRIYYPPRMRKVAINQIQDAIRMSVFNKELLTYLPDIQIQTSTVTVLVTRNTVIPRVHHIRVLICIQLKTSTYRYLTVSELKEQQ